MHLLHLQAEQPILSFSSHWRGQEGVWLLGLLQQVVLLVSNQDRKRAGRHAAFRINFPQINVCLGLGRELVSINCCVSSRGKQFKACVCRAHWGKYGKGGQIALPVYLSIITSLLFSLSLSPSLSLYIHYILYVHICIHTLTHMCVKCVSLNI
jgi:hypothetical protein